MRLGITFEKDNFKLNFGIRSYGFAWLPCEEQSGSSYPARFLDVPYGDRYWVYSWLWFVLFLVKDSK